MPEVLRSGDHARVAAGAGPGLARTLADRPDLIEARGGLTDADRSLLAEFDLLATLARNAGIVLGHAALYEQVWGYDYGDSNNLAVYVRYLRRKTEESGEPRLIHTVRGIGYVLSTEPR
ncbi:MAG: winged helix-turn-helix domain-containing protein [Microthrixaceae bacterium]